MSVRRSHILRHPRHNGSIGTPVTYCGREAGNGAKPVPSIEAAYEFLSKVSKAKEDHEESHFCQGCLGVVIEALQEGLNPVAPPKVKKTKQRAGKGYLVKEWKDGVGLN